MGRRGLSGLFGLFGVVLASCAAVPASTRVDSRHEETPPCAARRGSTARPGRPGDPDDPPPAQVRAMLRDFTRTLRRRYGVADERLLEASRRTTGRLVIPLRFHVIADGANGRVPRSSIDEQVRTLNAAYGGAYGGADTGVTFRLDGVDVTDDARWFERPYLYQAQMEKALSRGGRGTLNLYTAAVGLEVLGFSAFPQWYRDRPGRDAVVVDYRSLPGGRFQRFGRGFTAVHEIGHWLGLFHTFQNGCRPPGDGVDDTPYEALPTLGCPDGVKDTCPEPGADPAHNFMDYGQDGCMSEFTPGQGLRIRAMWAAYRAGDPRDAHRGGGPRDARRGGGPRDARRAAGAEAPRGGRSR